MSSDAKREYDEAWDEYSKASTGVAQLLLNGGDVHAVSERVINAAIALQTASAKLAAEEAKETP